MRRYSSTGDMFTRSSAAAYIQTVHVSTHKGSVHVIYNGPCAASPFIMFMLYYKVDPNRALEYKSKQETWQYAGDSGYTLPSVTSKI